MTTPILPTMDYTKYGREISEYDECEGFVVTGHDRRSWAALLWKVRDVEGPGYHVDPTRVDVRWIQFEELCGCTPEEHSQHLIKDEKDGDWWDCTCEYTGLPPCNDQYSWMSVSAKEDTPGAVPVLEWRW